MNELLSFDPGYGAIKLFGRRGGLVLPSNVSVALGDTVGRMAGLRAARPPLRVETDSYSFYVGAEAHAWGNPVESLDLDRLTGAPEHTLCCTERSLAMGRSQCRLTSSLVFRWPR